MNDRAAAVPHDAPRLHGTATMVAWVFGFCVAGSVKGWSVVPDVAWELVLLGAAVVTVGIVIHRAQRFHHLHIALAVLGGYALLALVSVLASAIGDAPFVLWQERLMRAIIVGFVAYLLASDLRQARSLTAGAISGAVVVALGGLTGFLGLDAIDPDNGRLAGPVGDPNYYAQFQAVAVVLAARFALSAREGVHVRFGALIATSLGMWAVIASESRGGLVTIFIVMGLIFVGMPPRHRRRALVIGAVLVVLALGTGTGDRLSRAPGSVTGALSEEDAIEDTAVAGRVSENLAAVRMFIDHPVFGVGWANYPRRYLDYSPEIAIDARAQERQAHNYHLEVLAETGLVGALVWLAILIAVFGLIGEVRHDPDAPPGSGVLADAWRLALWAWVLTSIFLHDIHPDLQWFLIGGALGLTELGRRSLDHEPTDAVPSAGLRSAS